MAITGRNSFLGRLAERVGLNRWFLREAHRFRQAANHSLQPSPGLFLSPAESLLDLVAPIGPDGLIPDKPWRGRPRTFSLKEMLKTEEEFARFEGGLALRLYLAPYDLHYLLAPCDMTLLRGTYVPGSVLPLVFCRTGDVRNERLTLVFQTEAGFPLVMVLIASLFVCGMECSVPVGGFVGQGERLGHFRLGSTVVLCLPPGVTEITARQGAKLRLGEELGRMPTSP
jgi:phosphatidylserine decarboxylase